MTNSDVQDEGRGEGRTSDSLLARAVAGDPAAWERLVALYAGLVFHWCGRWGLRGGDAENVVQEVLAAVAAGLPRFDPSRGSFRAWLHATARHECVDYLRRSAGEAAGVGGSDALRRQLQIPDASAGADEAVLAEERRVLYRRALQIIQGGFSQTDWEAFRRVVCDEQRPADVARELGVSVNKVYLAKSRILRKLRQEFRDLIDL
jgi:RNA polymerase sigma-70 factor (ECF subfamily)